MIHIVALLHDIVEDLYTSHIILGTIVVILAQDGTVHHVHQLVDGLLLHHQLRLQVHKSTESRPINNASLFTETHIL